MSSPPVQLWWEAIGESDAAATVVLVPDAQRPAAYWPKQLLDGLTGAGWQVVRLDLRDQGRSPWTAEPYSLADLVVDVAGVCREASAGRPCHLVGHGLGGAVALQLAFEAGSPPRFDLCGLTVTGTSGWLIDPSLPGPEEPVAVGLIWRTRMGEGRPDRLVRAVSREHRLLMAEGDDVGGPAAMLAVDEWLSWGFNPRDGHHRAWLEAADRWMHLAGLGLPLTVVHGSADPLVPLVHGLRLARTVSGARLVEIEGGGHALTPRHVDALLAAVGPAGGVRTASPPTAGPPAQ
jgi:pimeloyl-ACP methyl ester carboxylesterase